MSVETQELLDICEQLPESDRAAVADYARSLLAPKADDLDNPDDARWQAILDDPRPRPRLDAFLEESMKEPAEPMDLDRLLAP